MEEDEPKVWMADPEDKIRDQMLDEKRAIADAAEAMLREEVRILCPKPHLVKQHRDRRPPWCEKCGRDARGNRINGKNN